MKLPVYPPSHLLCFQTINCNVTQLSFFQELSISIMKYMYKLVASQVPKDIKNGCSCSVHKHKVHVLLWIVKMRGPVEEGMLVIL